MAFHVELIGLKVEAEYHSCGSHRVRVIVELDEEGAADFKKQIQHIDNYLEALKKDGLVLPKKMQIPVADEETMGDYNKL